MSKRQIRKEPFWKLALRYALIFMLVVAILNFGMEIIKGNFNKFMSTFHNGEWVQNVINLLIIGVVYGITSALIMKTKAKKS